MKKLALVSAIIMAVLASLFIAMKIISDRTVVDKDGMVYDPAKYQNSSNDQTVVDGGVTDNSDSNSNKTIESKEITSFEARFSTVDRVDCPFGYNAWKVKAVKEGDKVSCSFRVLLEGSFEQSFETDTAFMDELFRIVDECELASFNGHDYNVSGLPDEFGADLNISFESGETIYSHDNQDNYLPDEAMLRLIDLFESGAVGVPEVIDIYSAMKFKQIENSNGSGFIEYPELNVGKRAGDGEYVIDEKFRALQDAIKDIAEESEQYALEMEKGIEEPEQYSAEMENGVQNPDSYYNAELYVTKNDSVSVSFYERRILHSDSEDNDEASSDFCDYVIHNLNPYTGIELGFTDVFNDPSDLSGCIIELLRAKYPDMEFYDDAETLIRTSIEDGDGNISFALDDGFAHIFIREYVVADIPAVLCVALAESEYPGTFRRKFTLSPPKTFRKLDYDQTYKLGGNVTFSAGNYFIPEEDSCVLLTYVNGKKHQEEFYGYAPKIYLERIGEKNYLYLNIPVGDVSFYMNIYEISENGITNDPENNSMRYAVSDDTDYNPDNVTLIVGEVLEASPLFLYPSGEFTLEDGSFVHNGDMYYLNGGKVKLTQNVRVDPVDPEDAKMSGGMINLFAGDVLTPYETDMDKVIRFKMEDGRGCQLYVDGFTSEALSEYRDWFEYAGY